jgi:hypothetical protein
VPIRLKADNQKNPINFGSRSEIITRGIPQSADLNTSTNITAQSSAVYVASPGRSRIRLINLSVTDRIVSYSFYKGSTSMKSIAIV